jgi:SAM-dependent methyltransferase
LNVTADESETMPFAAARHVENLSDCIFYHSTNIPGYGTVVGQWDLRPGIEQYLGHFDFKGKRALDVGTASGFLTFHAERAGAEVISFDLSEGWPWDIVPFHGANLAEIDATRRAIMQRVNNGYWLCHRAFGSRAKAVYGTVYDIPLAIGPVDVAVYGSILLHLRDPFLALENGSRLAREAMIIADVCPLGSFGRFLRNPWFLPNHTHPDKFDTWWSLPPRLVQEYLAILGFKYSKINWHRQLFLGKKQWLYTIVARRG